MSNAANKFKVGDRIEFVEDYTLAAHCGATGEVVGTDESVDPAAELLLYIKLDSGVEVSAYDYHVKHVEAYALPKDFRFFRRSDGAISQAPYPTFEAALEGWRGFAQNGDQTEIVELVSHGTYKATLKVEVVEPITEGV